MTMVMMVMMQMVKMTMITIQAPTGCFQYHFDTSGLMKSFNYEGGQYLNNQHYRICILASSDACQIEYTSEGEFMLEKWGNYKTVPYTRAGSTSTYCVQDYLSIPGASNSTSAPSSDRFCGGQLNSQYSYNHHHHHQSSIIIIITTTRSVEFPARRKKFSTSGESSQKQTRDP